MLIIIIIIIKVHCKISREVLFPDDSDNSSTTGA